MNLNLDNVSATDGAGPNEVAVAGSLPVPSQAREFSSFRRSRFFAPPGQRFGLMIALFGMDRRLPDGLSRSPVRAARRTSKGRWP